MATPTRTPRQWFQDSIAGPLGKRFNTGNKPDKEAFKALFDSHLNPTEVDDTATTLVAGHVKVALDTYAENRVDNFTDVINEEVIGIDPPPNPDKIAQQTPHTIAVMPHQLPNLVAPDGTEVKETNVAISKGGLTITAVIRQMVGKARRNFKIALNLGGSLNITEEKLALDGDETEPTDGKFYGKMNGKKGWFASFLPNWLWTPTEKKQLLSDGTNLFWSTLVTGTGGGSIPPDGKSLILKEGKMALRPRSTTLGQIAKAAVVTYDENGVYLSVDGITLKATDVGVLEGLNADEQSIKKTGARTLQSKLMYDAFPPNLGKAVGPPPPTDWHVSCAPVVHFTDLAGGMYVRIDPATMGYNAHNQLYVKSGAVGGDKVVVSDDFVNNTIDGKWSNQNAVIDTGYGDINGMIALPVILSNGIATIVNRNKAWAGMNPEMNTRLYPNIAAVINANSPVLLIGHIGYNVSNVVKDFVGFALHSTGYWCCIIMKNGAITNTVVTTVYANSLMHTFNVQVFDDFSAKFMIDNMDVGAFATGTCTFTYSLASGVDIRNKVAESNSVHIDFINILRDRDYSPNT